MSLMTPEEYNSRIHSMVPISAHLGIRAERLEAGLATLIMPFGPHMTRPVDVVSGPALMTLAEIALGAAVLTVYGGHMTVFTANLNIHFLRKAVACDIRAVSRVLKSGRTLSTADVEMTNAATGDLVAHATASFAVQERQY